MNRLAVHLTELFRFRGNERSGRWPGEAACYRSAPLILRAHVRKAPLLHHHRDRLPQRAPHIGHAYEVVATDAIARFQRLDGYDVFSSPAPTSTAARSSRPRRARALRRAGSWTATSCSSSAMVERMNCSVRRLHPHRPRRAITAPPQAIWERMAEERRYLPVEICRLVLGARRGLLTPRTRPA